MKEQLNEPTFFEKNEPQKIELTLRQMILLLRPGALQRKREEILAAWYWDRFREGVRPRP